MTSKFNLKKIADDYNDTLGPADKLTFFVVAATAVCILAFCKIKISASLIGIITTALSVFCALLFGLLIPAIDQARRLRERIRDIKAGHEASSPGQPLPIPLTEKISRIRIHHRLTEKLFSNTYFSITLSLLSVILFVILAFLDPAAGKESYAWPTEFSKMNSREWWFLAFGCLSIFSTVVFLLSVAMLLRRMYYTFSHDLQDVQD